MGFKPRGNSFRVPGGGRIAGSGVASEDYSEESGGWSGVRYHHKVKNVHMPHDKINPESLNGPVIIVQEGKKKKEG